MKLIATEHEEQSSLVAWAAIQSKKIPQLSLLYAIPNGGLRTPIGARRLKREGVRPGVPDLHLPVARGGYHGLWIEMKSANGRVSIAQQRWIENLRIEGHKVEVVYRWNDAVTIILDYLGS